MTTVAYYVLKLREELALKQKTNSNYSLRAYARDINLHPSTLSQIFKGNRRLPLKDMNVVMGKLRLSPKERTLFQSSLFKESIALDQIELSESLTKQFMLDDAYFKVIAEWEHYAVLELFNFSGFKCTPEEVAKKLDLTLTRARTVLDNLLESGLLQQGNNGRYIKTHADITTTEDVKSPALVQSHIETMTMGIEKIKSIDVNLRDFSSSTLAIDVRKIPEAKAIIREFRQKMTSLMKEGNNKNEVYQLAIQLYPLTPVKNNDPEEIHETHP